LSDNAPVKTRKRAAPIGHTLVKLEPYYHFKGTTKVKMSQGLWYSEGVSVEKNAATPTTHAPLGYYCSKCFLQHVIDFEPLPLVS
jgi:hypothetical protein